MKRVYVTCSIRVGGYEKREEDSNDYHYYVEIEDLASEIQRVCNELYEDGYEVISVVPMIKGISGIAGDGGWGESVTDGVIILGKLSQ